MEKEIKFAQNLRTARKENNLTAKELAEKLTLAPTTVSAWECGKSYPDLMKLVELSEILSVSLDYLVFGKHDSLLDSLTDMQKFLIKQTIKEFGQ